MMSCKQCTERHIGCHADCDKYLKEKYENDSMKRRIRQRLDKDRQQRDWALRTAERKKRGRWH